MTTSESDAKRNARSVARRRGAIAVALATLGAALGACGGAELEAAPLTIAECREVGGTPLFDPGDERPVAESCPEGLGFLGVFEEPFFGSDGGICCGGLDAAEPGAADGEPGAADGEPGADAEPSADAEPDDAEPSAVEGEPDTLDAEP